MFIHSFGHFHPENVIDNQFLQDLDIGVDDKWAVSRTGIRLRHTVLPLDYIRTTRNRDPREGRDAALYSNAQTGGKAAKMALERAGLSPSEIGMVIAGGSAPWMKTPPDASLIGDELGISAPAIDMNSACSSWAAQLHLLSSMKAEALPDFILLVIPENLTRTVNYSDRSDAVLMGDGSAATIVSPRVPAAMVVCQTYFIADPLQWKKVSISEGGHLTQEGGAIQNFAIRKTVEVVEKLRPNGKAFWFVGHQANLPMLQSACRRAGVPEARHVYNIDLRGDCGGAGGPSVISEQGDLLQPGEDIVVALVGAGLAWGGVRFSVVERVGAQS